MVCKTIDERFTVFRRDPNTPDDAPSAEDMPSPPITAASRSYLGSDASDARLNTTVAPSTASVPDCPQTRLSCCKLEMSALIDQLAAPSDKRRRIDRVIAACDLCRRRKVKCNGELPCAYCIRKNHAATCAFSSTSKGNQIRSAGGSPNTRVHTEGSPFRRLHSAGHTSENRDNVVRTNTPQGPRYQHDNSQTGTSLSPTLSRDDQQADTVVPLEGRILCDAQGKLIFIGDCAPLSFLQTVKHLITSEVDSGVPVQAARDPIIEITRPTLADQQLCPSVELHQVDVLVSEYIVASSGLVQLFQREDLLPELKHWASSQSSGPDDAAAAVFYLVLAIGAQDKFEDNAEAWFKHALNILQKFLCSNMNVSTVQGFTLVAVFMLRASQPNGAYLYFCKRRYM